MLYFLRVSLICFLISYTTNTLAINDSKIEVSTTNISITNKLEQADRNRRTNPSLFKQLLDELKTTQHQLTPEQEYYLNLLEGHHLTYSGKYYEAKIKLNTILDSEAGGEIKHRANHILVIVSAAEKDWAKGLYHLRKNIDFLPKIKNKEHYQNTILVSILFYNQLKQYSLALTYSNLLTAQQLSNKDNCLWHQLTLEAKFYLNELHASDNRISNAINICQEAEYKAASNILRLYKAKLFLSNNKPDDTLTLLLSYIEEVNNIRYPMLTAEVNNTIAKAYWELNDLTKAKKYAQNAQKANKGLTIIQQGVDTYKLLFQIEKATNNHQLALSHHEIFAALDKTNLDEIQAKHLAFQLAEHKSFEQESKIKLLNKKNALLEAEQELSAAKLVNIQLIIAALTLGISGLVLWGGRLFKTHKRIKELAEYDALTGIFNRGHFTHVTNSALKYCKNAQQDLSVIMFDLDHFKKVNDSFGHACGDWALKETIKVCQNIGRKNDIFARLGGEEFCLVLTSCTIDVAMLRAEACRAAIEEIITEESGCEFSITASFGVTDLKRSGFNLDKLLADADMAAYASKNAGRNRVTMFEVPETSQPKKLDNSWNYEK
jgi:diguanylate cyclase (GGDEF)-like protein